MNKAKNVSTGPGERKTNDGFTEQLNAKKIVNEQEQNKISNDQNNPDEQDSETEEQTNTDDSLTEDKKEGIY
jgi:hypothetical protein